MREHTITKMRDLLSDRDKEVLSDMKEQVRHRCRSLQEARMFLNRAASAGKFFNRGAVQQAAVRAGVTDQKAIRVISDLLANRPEAVLNLAFWKKMGRGAASAVLHGKFDPNYKAPKRGGALSWEASSLERIGGAVGTTTYRAGRALQKAEKWFNIEDPDQSRSYSRGSAFGSRAGAVDACAKKKVFTSDGRTAYIGYDMGSPEYERCMSDPSEQSNVNVRMNDKYYKHLPDVLKELGVDPDKYISHKRDEFTYKRGKYRSKRGKYLSK